MFIAARREISSADLRVSRSGPGKGPAHIHTGTDGVGFYIILDTPADCDALIAAAVEAKQLLDPPAAPAGRDGQRAEPASVAS